MQQSRRQFLLFITAGAAAAGIAACGGGGGNNTGAEDMTSTGNSCSTVNSVIANNHGHAMTVVEADVTAGTEKVFTFTGPHMHDVTVTAAMFTDLAAGKSVMATSTVTNSHSHQVTIRCIG